MGILYLEGIFVIFDLSFIKKYIVMNYILFFNGEYSGRGFMVIWGKVGGNIVFSRVVVI